MFAKSRTVWQNSKLCQHFRRNKRKIAIIFWPEIFATFWAGSLVVRESRDSDWHDRISDKNSQKRIHKEKKNVTEIFFKISGCASLDLFIFYLAAEKLTFWGGGMTSKSASQLPSWGIYKHAPSVFWRKRRCCWEQQRERAAQPSKEPQRGVTVLMEKWKETT